MQSKLKLDHQTQAVAMATGGAAIAAIVAMFVPTGIWETLTGSTGVSEMIPATAAPLGDTARALIAFAFGALTFAILAVMLLRKNRAPKQSVIAQPEIEAEIEAGSEAETAWSESESEAALADVDEEEAEKSSLLSRLRDRISAFAAARRGAGEITDLEDLPKLRSGDAHPDAPPRRPLLATRDLVEPDETEVLPFESISAIAEDVEDEVSDEPVAAVLETESTVEIETEVEAEDNIVASAVAEEIPTAAGAEADASLGSLAGMVSRLETALAERDAKLARLEALVANRPASNVQPIREAVAVAVDMQPAETTPVAAVTRPVLETVDPEPAPIKGESEELDAALRSALETLHRMNARTR